MGAAAGRSAHLGPAPSGRPPRSLLLLQLLLLVWAPGAAGTQGAEFPELCRWVARLGAGFCRAAPARGGRGGGQGRSGEGPGSPSRLWSGLGSARPRGKVARVVAEDKRLGVMGAGGGRGGSGGPALAGVRRRTTCGCH